MIIKPDHAAFGIKLRDEDIRRGGRIEIEKRAVIVGDPGESTEQIDLIGSIDCQAACAILSWTSSAPRQQPRSGAVELGHKNIRCACGDKTEATAEDGSACELASDVQVIRRVGDQPEGRVRA